MTTAAQAVNAQGILATTPETARLALDVGGERTRFDVDLRFSEDDAEAARHLAAGTIGNYACGRLRALRVQEVKVCDWMRFVALSGSQQQAIIAQAEEHRVRLSFAVPTDTFFRVDETIVVTQIERLERTQRLDLAIRLRPPFTLTGADPHPASVNGGMVIFHPSIASDGPFRIHLVRGPPRLQTMEPTARLLRSASPDERRRATTIAAAVNVIAGGIGLLVPLLATIGLLRRLGRGRARRRAREAVVLTWALALLVALPVADFGHTLVLQLVPSLLPYVDRAVRGTMIESHAAGPLAFWVTGSVGTFLVAVIFAVGARAFTHTCQRLGVPVRFPTYRFALALVLFALPIQLLPLAVGLVGGPQTAAVPLEVHAGLALLVWAALLIWITRAGLKLIAPAGGAWFAASAILTLSLLPWRGWPDFMPAGGGAAQFTAAYLISHLRPLAHAAILVPLLWLLRELGSRTVLTARAHLSHLAGGAAFAAALMPLEYGWPGLLSALAALMIVWPRLALCDPASATARARLAPDVLSNMATWVERLENAASLRSASRSTKLDAKLSEGEIGPDEWSERRRALEAARDRAVDAVFLPGGLNARDLVLGMSVQGTAWRSGLRAAAFGASIVAILTLFRIVQGESLMPTPIPALAWLGAVLPPAMKMGASAFLLGYFFDRLRGGTGLNKALWLGTAFCVAESLIWLPRLGEPNAVAGMLWSFSQHFLVLIPVGVLAFDYGRMRQVEGNGFDWRRFSWFGDPRLLSTGIAAILAALGPTVATLFSGTFASAVKDVVTAVAPTLTKN